MEKMAMGKFQAMRGEGQEGKCYQVSESSI